MLLRSGAAKVAVAKVVDKEKNDVGMLLWSRQ
jgi:hypothetical protein